MSFQSNVPISGPGFSNRSSELARLDEVARRLGEGEPTWLAILGARKVGKTSLVLEFARRHRADLAVIDVDVSQWAPLTWDVFRVLAARAADVLAGAATGISHEALLIDEAAWRREVPATELFARLPPTARASLASLPELDGPELARAALGLPEAIAQAMDVRAVVAIDEFQDLAALAAGRGGVDPFPILRGVWQRHRRIAYVVSGSERSMMLEMVSSEASPFFQHFSVMELDVLGADDAIALLVDGSPADRRIDAALAARAVDVIGTHPFHLQMLGEALVAAPGPYREADLKAAVQGLVFARAGRLSLFFAREWDARVGRASTLAATLEALAAGKRRLTDIAAAIGAPSGATLRYLERLGDSVTRADDGTWRLTDPLFARWIEWRSPGGSVVPMRVLGDEGEQAAARSLSRLGFELVYQSLGSRGAFDLLATRGHHVLAVQVKRRPLPLRFTKAEWARMVADAKRMGWRWVIAAVDDSTVRVLDPGLATKRGEVRLGERAEIANLLAWIDETR